MHNKKYFKKFTTMIKGRNKTIHQNKKINTSQKNKETTVSQKAKEEISAQRRLEELEKLEEAFWQGRQEYINLFRDCPDALCYTNIDGIILMVNHSFEKLTGYHNDELKGDSLIYGLKPQEKPFFETDYGDGFIKTRIRKKDGAFIEVAAGRAFNQARNRIAGIIFSFSDISGQRREQKIHQALFHISKLTSSAIPLQEIYVLIHQQLAKIIDATNFYVAIRKEGTGQLDFPYYTDEAAGDNEIFINRYCSSQSIFHYILKIGKPVLMDFQQYRKMLSYGYIEPWDVMTNTHLWLGVPLRINQGTIGVIALQSYKNARLYSQKDIVLLEFVSQQLSHAIFRDQAEQTNKHTDQVKKGQQMWAGPHIK